MKMSKVIKSDIHILSCDKPLRLYTDMMKSSKYAEYIQSCNDKINQKESE
jgi:hypothetical protein